MAIEILTLAEAKEALRTDGQHLDTDIQSSIDAGVEQLQEIVRFDNLFNEHSNGIATAKRWIIEYMRELYWPDYENTKGKDSMAVYLKDIVAKRGVL